MYDWFSNLIGAPSNPDTFIVTCCGVALVLCICVAVKCCFQAIDYMVGGRKR